MTYYRILALDGGGIRGVLTITLLQQLEKEFPGFISQFDMFAGTSTGGILSLALAAGKTLQEALTLYSEKGGEVFKDSLIDNVLDFGFLRGAQYSNKALKVELEGQFGEMTLGDLKKQVLISSFDLDNMPANPEVPRTWKPKFFHNFVHPKNDTHEKVVDVALRTAAAPLFFPIFQGYVDGGVVANNPSMCALAQALDEETGNRKLSEIVLLSVSTGTYPKYLESVDGDWGLLRWGKNLIEIMLEGNVEVAHYQCSRLLGRRYHRIAPKLYKPISLGDVTEIPVLSSIGRQYDLTEARKFLRRYFD